ncbi:MAG: molybdenum cofactor biosynthesis protein MoaE [Gemmatimonadota bacterium]
MRFWVTEEPLHVEALASEVAEATDGAVVTFAGVVRNHSGDRSTQYLVYEAYPEMAAAKLEQVGREAMGRWAIGDVAIAHRVGRLEIGEVSVAIAVASPHRAEAFEACRFAIDRIKEIVPIWKKEYTLNGDFWVEGPVAAAAS